MSAVTRWGMSGYRSAVRATCAVVAARGVR